MSNEKHYPLHPNQSHPPIMTCEIPLEEYESLKREHHKERDEYIEMVAQHKAKLVEQESENRRLKRALYKACANWADVVAFEETDGIGHDNSVAERWRKMESKCLKKAKEYL